MNEKHPEADAAAIEASVQIVTADAGVDTAAEGDIFEELAKLQLENDERSFESLDEVFEAEHREQLGVWQRWPDVADGEVLLAHITTSNEKRERLEERFREKHQIEVTKALGPRVLEGLFRESFFGTVVRGWRGKTFEGTAFNEENLRKLMKSRRFRVFVLSKARSSEAFRGKTHETLRGNS